MEKDKLIEFITIPKIFDDCLLFFAEHHTHIPFHIRRIYYILKANTKLSRGFHAHFKTKQALFCLSGGIKIVLKDGIRKKSVILDKPDVGIFLDKMIWHEMYDFKKNTIILVLASRKFSAKDYIRDYKKFLEVARENEKIDKFK